MRKTFWLLLLILSIATFLRLYHFTSAPPGLYPDEAVNGNNALAAMHSGNFRVFYPDNNGREGLFINIQALFLKIFKANEPWVLRLPSALAGILTVLGIYFLAAELFGAEIGFLAAFFLATNFWHVNFSRIGFRAILAPLCLVWSSCFFIKSLRAKKYFGKFGFWIIYAAAAGIIYAAGFYTYIAYRITPLLFLLFIPFFKKYPGFWKRAAAFVAITFILCLPIGYYFLTHQADFFGRTSQLSIFSSQTPLKDLVLNVVKTAAMFNFRGDYNWRHNIGGSPELFWPVGILFILGIALGISSLWRKLRKYQIGRDEKNSSSAFPLLFILLWLLLAGLPVVISNEGIPHALRSILLIPPAIMLAAVGGIEVYKLMLKFGAGRILKVIAYVFLGAIAVSAYIQYFITWAKNPSVAGAFSADYVAIGRKINSLPLAEQKYVVVEASGVPVGGIPMPAQTVMFITDTYSPERQAEKNVRYILPGQESRMPPHAAVFYLR